MRLCEIDDLAKSAEWWDLWAGDPCQHPWYLPDQLAVSATNPPSMYYLPPQHRTWLDPSAQRWCRPLNLLAVDDLGPVMALPLSVEHIGDTVRLSAFGRPLHAIEDVGASDRRRKAAATLVHRRLEELRREHGAEAFHLRDFLADGRLSALSELMLRAGGSARPFFSQMVDLTMTLPEIQANFRASLRNLVRRQRSGFTVELVTADNVGAHHPDLLRQLHRAQHGHELRRPDSWSQLAENVSGGTAFMIFGLVEGEYVSGAYLPYSGRYCHYSIAANDPAGYGSGLSHRILWRAMEHSRGLGCRYFEVGDRLYPGQHDFVAEKFHAISHFKAGFSNSIAVRLDVLAGGVSAGVVPAGSTGGSGAGRAGTDGLR